MSPDAIAKRKATEACMKKNVDAFIPYFNKEEMPTFIIPQLKALGINGLSIKGTFGGYVSPGFSQIETGAIGYTLNKYDSSVAVFLGNHNAIGSSVVAELGDQE
jgi:alkylation response protein AidB-like acyl-CoA dehydrogenase